MQYTIFETDLGWVGVLGSGLGIKRLCLPRPSAEAARQALACPAALANDQPFTDLAKRLRAYFQGKNVSFPDRLDLSAATTFQRAVWQATSLIPRGKTRSYGWVAGEIGNPRAARGVGQALARNPLPIIIPCHRVLASNGRLGGFGGGLELKKRLLALESPA